MPSNVGAPTTLARYGRLIDARDWDGLTQLLTPAFTGRFVHTGQTFDREAYVAFNRDYPGRWRFDVEDEIEQGDRAVCRARVHDDTLDTTGTTGTTGTKGTDPTYYVACFARLEQGRIAELVEVWTDAVVEDPS